MAYPDRNPALFVCAFALLAALATACGSDATTSGEYSGDEYSGVDAGSGTHGPGTAGSGDTGSTWTGADTSADAAWGASDDASTADADAGSGGGNTNVNLGGEQDFGYFRRLLDSNIVPHPDDFDAAGFFAEHHTELPMPMCGERICLQTMLGVLSNLINGNNCTLLQLGLNSPLTADPANRPPLDLVVVVDVSGSMAQGGKIDFVNRGLEILVDSLYDEDQIALVTYSNEANTVLDLTEVRLNRSRIRGRVSSLEPNGGTNLYAGLEAGYRIALDSYDSGRQTRVILLSDGQPTVGITDEDSILGMSRSFNSEGIGVTSIGLGTSFNFQLMRGIAEQGDGNFYFLESAAAVDEVFEEELSYFTVPVAYDLTLELAEGSDYFIRAVHGSRLWATQAGGGRLDIPSVFLAHRESADDVHEGGGRRGGGSALMVELMPRDADDDGSGRIVGDVGHVTLTFREPGTDRIVTEEIGVEYPHAPWILLGRGHFDAPSGRADIIQKSFVMFNIYSAMRSATEAFHRLGVAEVEIGVLETLIAAVEDYNEEIEDTDMEYDIALMRQLIDVLLANGALPLPPEWTEPEDPWPCD